MLNTTLSRARFVTHYSLSNRIPKRCFSYEDRGRMRCPLKIEPFTQDLMPFPKKPKALSTEEAILESDVMEYNKNMQLPSANIGGTTRYDDIYYSCTKRGQRRYAQTWIEGPSPPEKPNLLSELDENIEPVPFERRNLDERPITAKPMSSHSRRFHSWYKKFMQK